MKPRTSRLDWLDDEGEGAILAATALPGQTIGICDGRNFAAHSEFRSSALLSSAVLRAWAAPHRASAAAAAAVILLMPLPPWRWGPSFRRPTELTQLPYWGTPPARKTALWGYS